MTERLKKLHPKIKFIKGERVMKLCDVDAFELVQMVRSWDLPVYDPKTREPMPITLRNTGIIESNVEKLLFKPDEVRSFYENVKESVSSIHADKKVFPCLPGTKWNQIEMALLPSGEKFMVKSPLGHGYYDHIDLNLHDNRMTSKGPNRLWRYFLKPLAKGNGFIPLKNIAGDELELIYSMAKRLNQSLKQTFRINESIYKDRNDKNRKHKTGGYETKFKIYLVPDDKFTTEEKTLHRIGVDDIEGKLNLKEYDYYPEQSSWQNEE